MTKYNGSGRLIERGFLAAHKQDFLAHIYGNDFRHAYFVFVGGTTDNVDYRVGSDDYPTFNSAMTAALADTRLANGGTIIIKAGTYTITETIEIPSKINLVGESTETILVGETDEQPLFKILKSTDNLYLDEDSVLVFDGYVDSCQFKDLVLTDNSNQTIQEASHAKATMTTVSMIQCEVESNFVCENVKFLGRLNYGPELNRVKTFSAISYTSSGSTSTKLTLDKCFFDGLKIAINFTPSNGINDYLSVNNCKARLYGTEGATTASLNCFVNSSICNANICDNYVLGSGSEFKYVLNICDDSGILDNVKIVLNNNFGYNANVTELFNNETSSTVEMVVSGNNWGYNTNNEWFITVGSTDINSNKYTGDFSGDDAINLLIKSGISDALVIVNPGIYNINGETGNTSTSLRFKGNKIGSNYPLFRIQSASSNVDNLGNKYLTFGNYFESIHFISYDVGNTLYNSIFMKFDPNDKSSNCQIIDCLFYDCTLRISNIETIKVDNLGKQAFTSIVLKDCQFKQTDSFPHNLSLVLPSAHNILIENCYFSGVGYVGKIGQDMDAYGPLPYLGYYPKFTLRNCSFNYGDMDVVTKINVISPLGTNYLLISEQFAEITLDSCKFTNRDGTYSINSEYQAVDNSLLADGYFSDYVKITGSDIFINNCIFNSPTQEFTYSGEDYSMVGLSINPTNNCILNNCNFIDGSAQCQIKGLDKLTFNGQVKIDGCNFSSITGTTLLDIDFEFTSAPSYFPSININNNRFYQDTYNANQVLHNYNLRYPDGYYEGQGVVQIYSPYCFVNFDNNYVVGRFAAVPFATEFQNYSSVYIDAINTSYNILDSYSKPNLVSLTNNTIIFNIGGSWSNQTNLGCAIIESAGSRILQNNFNITDVYQYGTWTSFQGCLLIKTANYPSIVSHNTFGNLKEDNSTYSNLTRGYVQISPSFAVSSPATGSFIDNIFLTPMYEDGYYGSPHLTTTGNVSSVISDGSWTSALYNWIVARNKNQPEEYNLNISNGCFSMHKYHESRILASGRGASNSTTDINSSIYAVDRHSVRFSFDGNDDDTNPTTFSWDMDLSDILPVGARIKSISYDYDLSNASATSRDVTISLDGNVDTPDPTTPHTVTNTFTLDSTSGTKSYSNFYNGSYPFFIYPRNKCILSIYAELCDNSSFTLDISNVIITYIQ